jgi:GT2 family glycosyltransferase
MTTSVAIAIATRGRPKMFRDCLQSLARMQLPAQTSLTFLLVENDKTLTIAPLAEELASLMGDAHSVEALLEPEAGIPFARNKALDRAQELNCDWLIYIDDDEEVDADWLLALMRGAQQQQFDLAAGPVEQLAPEGALSGSEQAVFDYFIAEGQRRRKIRESRLHSGQADRNDIATNNWIGRLSAFRAANLRFDEDMRYTGGSDTDLSRRAKAAGLKIGWVPDAIVREVIPQSRLTYRYVYDRSRSQTLAKYHIRYRKQGRHPVVKPLIDAFVKAVVGSVRLLFGLTGNTRMRIKAMRTLGVAMGWTQGALGAQSQLYRKIQGG